MCKNVQKCAKKAKIIHPMGRKACKNVQKTGEFWIFYELFEKKNFFVFLLFGTNNVIKHHIMIYKNIFYIKKLFSKKKISKICKTFLDF